ncbi:MULTISPECIES: hypothetical protein [Paraburkholderia]|jgi:hypothetical protein|nr:hypothetical protein [Paraburkholderia caribensis]
MIMDRHAVHYRRHVIIPLASVGTRGYAASVFVTGPSGRRKAFGILGYFSSEEEAIEYATSCAKARIEGNRMPGLPRKLSAVRHWFLRHGMRRQQGLYAPNPWE